MPLRAKRSSTNPENIKNEIATSEKEQSYAAKTNYLWFMAVISPKASHQTSLVATIEIG